MGAQQGKEQRGVAGGGAALPPNPPPLAGRLGERQGSRIKGLRPRRDGQRLGGNIFTEHNGEYTSSPSKLVCIVNWRFRNEIIQKAAAINMFAWLLHFCSRGKKPRPNLSVASGHPRRKDVPKTLSTEPHLSN